MSYSESQLRLAKQNRSDGFLSDALNCAVREISRLTQEAVPVIAQQYADADTAIAYLEVLIAAEDSQG